jgi:hypothetical protein
VRDPASPSQAAKPSRSHNFEQAKALVTAQAAQHCAYLLLTAPRAVQVDKDLQQLLDKTKEMLQQMEDADKEFQRKVEE